MEVLAMRRLEALAVCSLLPAALLAQAPTGTVSGSVTDTSGGTLTNATVSLINERTGARRQAMTEADGFFRFPDAQPASSELAVQATGFRQYSHKGIQVAVNR